MVKATRNEGKSKITEVKGRKQKARREKNPGVQSGENAGLRERKAKSTGQEEAEELRFVPSAISVTQNLVFRCDNQCNGKTLSVWQLGVGGDTGKVRNHTRPNNARNVTTIL